MAALYLRRAAAPELVVGPLAVEDALALRPAGCDGLSFDPTAPLSPLSTELGRDGALREALAEACPMPAAARYARLRGVLLAGLLPLLMLAELDRELVGAGRDGARGALAVDLLLAAAVVADLARPLPRRPAATALTFAAAAARLLLLVTAPCAKGVHAIVFLVLVVAAACAIGTVALSPTPADVARHVRRSLGLAEPTPPPRAPPAYLAVAVAAAAGLPLLSLALRRLGLHALDQIVAVLAVGAAAAWLGARMSAGPAGARHRPSLGALSGAVVLGLVVVFGLVRGSQHLLDAWSFAERCLEPRAYATSALRRFLDGQRAENTLSHEHPGAAALLLTAFVAPVAEELVFRGLLQRALGRLLPRAVALVATSLLFGLSHVFVYVYSAWQAVLLGIGFGIAYEAAGVGASIAVHVLWNLWLAI